MERSRLPHALVAAVLLGGLSPVGTVAGVVDPAAALTQAVAAAEKSLREDELETAESQYRLALLEGWLVIGQLETAAGRLPEAQAAFRAASVSAVETRRSLLSLALTHLRMGQAEAAAGILGPLARRYPQDPQVRRLQARVARSSREPEPPRPDPGIAALSPSQRLELARRVTAELRDAYLNLGVLHARRGRYSRAAELFDQAAALDPDSAKVQYSLGVARFNARQFDRAVGPLARARVADPLDAGLRRMLAMAWLNTGVYDKAADLLRDDPERETDASLQFALGLALARTDRAAEARSVFGRLLERHGDSAEVRVVLGQANAQQGDFDAAVEELTRALQLRADVAEANATLGVIYLKQGRLAEAEAALRAELRTRPDDAQSLNTLATVLDLEGRPEEAVPLLRGLLASKPDFANARYLLGKILLAQDASPEALQHLEAAVRLAPDDANIHYQLGRAYQKLGRAEDAQREFDVFRQLKDKRRGSTE